MEYRFKPKNRDKLLEIIKEIVFNQENDPDYKFGLKDIDVSLITDMSELFFCNKYDKNSNINEKIDWNDYRNNITNWNVYSVTDMTRMFYNSNFNQSIGHWNVSQVTNMGRMFYKSHFNQPIGKWNVSHVTNMSNMFYESDFDQPIENWDVSHVTNMFGMFSNSPFNQDISQWNVSHVTDMYAMFEDSSFEHNLYTWINRLNKNIDLEDFNKNSPHEKKYGSIHNIDDFIENQLTPQIWLNEYKKGNDREKFQLLKLLKNRDKTFIEELNSLLKENRINIEI